MTAAGGVGAEAPAPAAKPRNPNRTPVEVEERVVEMIKAGKTRPEIQEATGVSRSVLSRIAKDYGVEFQRNGSGSSGTPEAADVARGFRSDYQRAKREATATKLLEQMVRTADLLAADMAPRDRQSLAQSLDALTRAYANITKTEVTESEKDAMLRATSTLDQMIAGMGMYADEQTRIGAQVRRRVQEEGITDPKLIYGENLYSEAVGDYGSRMGDVMRDGKRRPQSNIQG